MTKVEITHGVLVLPDRPPDGEYEWLRALVDPNPRLTVPDGWQLGDVEWPLARSVGGQYILMVSYGRHLIGTMIWDDLDEEVTTISVHPAWQRGHPAWQHEASRPSCGTWLSASRRWTRTCCHRDTATSGPKPATLGSCTSSRPQVSRRCQGTGETDLIASPGAPDLGLCCVRGGT